MKLTIVENGPYLIENDSPTTIYNEKGEPNPSVLGGKYYLCACGKSNKKPFCDGNHKLVNQ